MEDVFQKALDSLGPCALSAAVIDLNALAANYHKVHEKLSFPRRTAVAGVVKANAYGFGAVEVSNRLYKEGCRDFFVATVEEGLEVRRVLLNDARIFLLGGVLAGCEHLCFINNLTPVLNCMSEVELWAKFCKSLGQRVPAAIQVDTGMVRNGLSLKEVEAHHSDIFSNIDDIVFVMSHLACPDEPKHYKNAEQLERFNKVLDYFRDDAKVAAAKSASSPDGSNKSAAVRGSLSATNGIFLGAQYQFDIVRPGKALYGFSVRKDLIGTFEPVMNIFARITQINEIAQGETIGYGATFVAPRPMRTATLGIGYADGFMRKFDGFGHAFICGQRLPLVGRISMDYAVVDVTDLDPKVGESELKVGGWVALTQSPDYTLEKWALQMNTLPHEVACRFGRRVHKVYIGG